MECTSPTRHLTLLVLALAAAGCGREEEEAQGIGQTETELVEPTPDAVYVATFRPVNDELTDGMPAGQARVTLRQDTLVVEVDARDLPPEIMHMQHLHGFTDGETALCPDPAADPNADGVLDLTEMQAATGVTMVPQHTDPANLALQGGDYPIAGTDGGYTYTQIVQLDELLPAFADQFGGEELMLGDRVIVIHGVWEDTELPPTVQSVADAPAHETVPIACGELALEE